MGCTIVVADDSADTAESLSLLLQLDGHEVHVALDGRHALNAILELKPHVALLDIAMPLIDGYEIARTIRQQAPEDPVRLVAITGYGQAKDIDLARAAGFDEHWTKPINPEALQQLISELETVRRTSESRES